LTNHSAILFEPWNLGDTIIAFATAIQDPDRIALACNTRWHSILRCAAQGQQSPELIPVDLGYVTRKKIIGHQQFKPQQIDGKAAVLSIRGDIRDYRAARSLFPASRIKMNGWIPFLAKRSSWIDLPFTRSWLPVRNRYRAWADLAEIDWDRIVTFYHRKRCSRRARVAIHIGAQWKSKQYPHAAELVQILQKSSDVQVIAAPGDPLPPGLLESDVSRLIDGDLVGELLSCTHLIANDSGPMHLGALLRCRTIVLSNRAAIAEWLPPEVIAVQPGDSPRGYHAPRLSDTVFAFWPHPQQVVESLFSSMLN